MNAIAITYNDFQDLLADKFAEAGVPLTEVKLLKETDGDYEEIGLLSYTMEAFMINAVKMAAEGHDVSISNADAEIHYSPYMRDGELYFTSDYDRKTYHIIFSST